MVRAIKPIDFDDIHYKDIDDFLAIDFPMMSDPSEYFKYHPPKTEERKLLHERVGTTSEAAYRKLLENNDEWDDYYYWCGRWEIVEGLINFAIEVCKEPTCLQWAIDSVVKMTNQKKTILMHIQQYRMFLNQGITIWEITKGG